MTVIMHCHEGSGEVLRAALFDPVQVVVLVGFWSSAVAEPCFLMRGNRCCLIFKSFIDDV